MPGTSVIKGNGSAPQNIQIIMQVLLESVSFNP